MRFLRYSLRAAKKIQRDYFKEPRIKGFLGEALVNRELKEENYLLYDIKILEPKKTQIDHILINQKGIIVIETKNYKGIIKGSINNKIWYQIINNHTNKFYNPIMQNKYHIDILKEVVNLGDIPIYSIVVFSDKAMLNIGSISNVIYINNLKTYINNLDDYNYNQDDIKSIYVKLKGLKELNK